LRISINRPRTRKIIAIQSLEEYRWQTSMCEFKVVLNGRVVWDDVVYAKVENGKVILRNVAGQSKEFENCKIVEVDVNTTRLVLASPLKHGSEEAQS